MSCFNKEIAIGVTTDFSQVTLESRFQMWGVYLWLNTYGVFTRMLCPRQGDENELNLPISYHPYYTQQSFQVGKRMLDVCLCIGEKLCCKGMEQVKNQGSILKKDAKILAYGLEETKTEEVIGKIRKKTNRWDASYYDTVFTMYRKAKDRLSETGADTEILINPYLMADTVHYKAEAQEQTLTEKPYIMVYAHTLSEEDCERISRLSKSLDLAILVNESFRGKLSGIRYTIREMDVLYGILYGAQYVVTDTAVIAGLTVQSRKAMTVRYGEDAGMPSLVKHYNLSAVTAEIPEDAEALNKLVWAQRRGRKKISKERIEAYRVLEDALGLTRRVDCPTDIRMSDCSGCYACHEICPHNAIYMERDEEGFVFPHVKKELCTECGLCKRACVGRENKQYASERISTEEAEEYGFPLARVGTCRSEEQLATSSSGGVFQSLARYIIEEKNGVVVGACYENEARVSTGFAETMEQAKEFSGSKYVKREPEGVYRRVKEYLRSGREVLFTGLPCECAGLRAYLQKEYDNLILCELVCHGGPSPKVYEKYIKHIGTALKEPVVKVDFRDKSKSWLWKDVRVRFAFQNRQPFSVRGRQNNYMNAFLKNYIFRVSCYRCQYLKEQRAGDITIGDCYAPGSTDATLVNSSGVSMIITNTAKGERLWQQVANEFEFRESTLDKAFGKNHVLSSVMPEEREIIMRKMDRMKINDLLEKYNPWKQKSNKR